MTSPLNVALLGFGFAGRTLHAPLIQAAEGLSLALIGTSQSPETVAEALGDLPRVLGDMEAAATDPAVDLVVLATPNVTHAPLARLALEHGKHVVVDKPFTLSLAEARGLTQLAAGRGRVLSVFQNRRWDSDFLTVTAAIAEGQLGEIVQMESRMDRYRPEVRDRWRERDEPGSGLLYDLGPHLIDQMLLLFGLPDRVTAHVARQRPGALATDWFQILLDYPRLQAVLGGSMLVSGGSRRFVAHGLGGSIVKVGGDVQEGQLRTGMAPRALDWGIDLDAATIYPGPGEPEMRVAADGDYVRYYALLAQAIREGSTPPVAPEEALAGMAVLEAALISAAEHRSLAPALDSGEAAAFERQRRASHERLRADAVTVGSLV